MLARGKGLSECALRVYVTLSRESSTVTCSGSDRGGLGQKAGGHACSAADVRQRREYNLHREKRHARLS